MATKYYAVRKPEPATVYTTWEECQRVVHGKAGAQFKSFPTRTQAEEWAGLHSLTKKQPITGLRVYVDGSFMQGTAEAGWAWVAVEDGKELAHKAGRTAGPAQSRNIDGECEATIQALRWLQSQGRSATICHDYEGLAAWAQKRWKAEKPVAKNYQQAVLPLLGKNTFEKVVAHTGDFWNERVDQLAKEALAPKSLPTAKSELKSA
ncbi:MAG TPA: ribonuclease H family protein [Fibrobacteraceae bacterium]|nr:ribonuclease H family protein [Fibrobacteraceae bacterium]